jgi:hypothetical protein
VAGFCKWPSTRIWCAHQFAGGLPHAFVLAADEDQAAGIASFNQGADEFDAVHLGHVEIEQDQVRRAVGGEGGQRRASAGMRGWRGVAEVLQHAAE